MVVRPPRLSFATAVPLALLPFSQGQTWDDITEELLEDCCQLVKANSIEGIPLGKFGGPGWGGRGAGRCTVAVASAAVAAAAIIAALLPLSPCLRTHQQLASVTAASYAMDHHCV